jgi:glutamate N-acetyltransferase/amino-acid N-acetyltransferase
VTEVPLSDVPGGTITTPRGFLAGATHAGIKYPDPDRPDLALLFSEQPCAAAGVYTQHAFRGPPILITERHLANGRAQAIIANSGVSNSLFGDEGMAFAEQMAEAAAKQLGVAPEDVVVASTGVTGWRLPIERIVAALPSITLSPGGGESFARAIMTTDTVPKQAAVRFEWRGVTYAVGGCAKGSGMIHPNMATMLAYMTTDAPVDPSIIRPLLKDAADESFNMLTIDGDTSPNDMVVLLANGAAGGETIGVNSPALPLLRAAVTHVAVSLTRQLARDGEGAGKLLVVRIDGAATVEDARRAARAIVLSPLVKTAVYGNDPNWGRVLVALGYSGARVRERDVALSIQGVEVFRGSAVPFDAAALSKSLAQEEVRIDLHLGAGDASATAYGCDLTPGYVRINSEYTT